MEPLLRTENLSKRFRTLSALRNINLEIYPGEVLGITGQTGSGKSTLANLLTGNLVPDEGKIYYKNMPLNWPFKIRSLGIEIIHQTPKLAQNLDITSNIFLGNEIGLFFGGKLLMIPDQLKMDQMAARILEDLELRYTSLREEVNNLSSEKHQLIAIAKVMTSSPELIIIDDPARTVSYPYQQKLLSLIQKWRENNISVIFISNNLDHLLDITDRILVLRKGFLSAEFLTEEADQDEIIAALVGTTDYQQLTPIIWALDSYYHAHEQAERLLKGQLLLERELIDQDSLRHKLIDQLTEQITKLDSTNKALENAQRRLLGELEKERKHLAREIHDQIIQDLLSINYQLEEQEANYGTNSNQDARLGNIRNSIRDLIDELRIICGNLRPPTLDSLGLKAALQSHANEWTSRTRIPIELYLDEEISRLPESIELSIYRIVQEALSNIYKHSQATQVQVSMKKSSPRALIVSISDNGQGIDDNFDVDSLAQSGHFGLIGVSERVALLGGRLKITNRSEGGVLIQVEIPHPRQSSPEEPERILF
jgi:signal transduction histidine kinase